MSKVIRIRLSESEYDLLSRTAVISGKGMSSFCREMLLQALKLDMKETATLSKLLQKLENLSEPQPFNAQSLSADLEQKLLAVFEVIALFANYFFIDRVKLQKLYAGCGIF